MSKLFEYGIARYQFYEPNSGANGRTHVSAEIQPVVINNGHNGSLMHPMFKDIQENFPEFYGHIAALGYFVRTQARIGIVMNRYDQARVFGLGIYSKNPQNLRKIAEMLDLPTEDLLQFLQPFPQRTMSKYMHVLHRTEHLQPVDESREKEEQAILDAIVARYETQGTVFGSLPGSPEYVRNLNDIRRKVKSGRKNVQIADDLKISINTINKITHELIILGFLEPRITQGQTRKTIKLDAFTKKIMKKDPKTTPDQLAALATEELKVTISTTQAEASLRRLYRKKSIPRKRKPKSERLKELKAFISKHKRENPGVPYRKEDAAAALGLSVARIYELAEELPQEIPIFP